MQITIEVPDEFASPLIPAGQDPARAALEAIALEAIALEAYRQAHFRSPASHAVGHPFALRT
jgi:hypothetical protein